MLKKSICYVVTSFPQPSETFIADEATSLLEFGITPLIISLNPGNTTVVHPSARRLIDLKLVHYLQPVTRRTALGRLMELILRQPFTTIRCAIRALVSKQRWRYVQALEVAGLCLEQNVAHVHAHFADNNLRCAETIAQWLGCSFGVTTHGYDLREDPIPVAEAKTIYGRASTIVTISHFNKKTMVDKFGIPPSRIKVVRCGIYLDRFAMKDIEPWPRERMLRGVNVGRLVALKGQDILLRALAIVKQRGVALQISIVGAGPLLDDLQDLAEELGIAASIRFLGAREQTEVAEIVRDADVFILPSRLEGLPVACIEALAIGTPVVATRITGIPELIEDKINGLLVAPDNAIELADAICWMDQNRHLINEIQRQGRIKVEQEFERLICTRALLEACKIDTNILETNRKVA